MRLIIKSYSMLVNPVVCGLHRNIAVTVGLQGRIPCFTSITMLLSMWINGLTLVNGHIVSSDRDDKSDILNRRNALGG